MDTEYGADHDEDSWLVLVMTYASQENHEHQSRAI